ncbi:hypothetical protein COF37_26050 [Bacillus wiedmannii]|uniref:hypothetical protein n=1 Tax=Bacillus wiedmannii TaxID=1890302 RepID=UPI000BFE1300|nr:hypothetical protein [Bacillus wiedmannii]PHD18274.1 hypothetical protein COF37_26050 [Bacillus wiedmannii]
MTLIAGIILPKGILMVSDTREMRDGIHIANELARKITLITPGTIIGTAGTGFSVDTAISLRKNLSDKVPTTPTSIREAILDEYKNKNKYVRARFPHLGPMAYILLGEYDDTTKTYTLLENTGKGDSLFDEIKIYNQLKDTVVIGSSLQLRTAVKNKIKSLLNTRSPEQMNEDTFFMELSHVLKGLFKKYADQEGVKDVNDKLYCAYLTTTNNHPIVYTYFFDSNKEYYPIDREQDGEYIQFTK